MRGGLAGSCAKIRVANPSEVMSRARIIGLVARWVMLLAEVLQDRLDLLARVEPVVLYGGAVGRLDLRDPHARIAPLLVELDAQGGVGQPPVRDDLAAVEAEEVPARAPQVRRRERDDDDEDDRDPAREPPEGTALALPARRPRARATALRFAAASRLPPRGARPGDRVPRRGDGRQLAGIAASLLGRDALLQVNDHDGHV